ncbi:MAG: hypothetical protein HQ517_07940 [SAR324 cluster bacterium]|nr:hypothetical protein [SAR324 cluster bacterium]
MAVRCRSGSGPVWSSDWDAAILAGWLIGVFHLQGYRICFLISSLCALLVAVLGSWFQIEDAALMPGIHLIIKPLQPLRSLQLHPDVLFTL